MLKIQYETCPDKFKGGLQRYFEHRIAPGSFLLAVLKNNLSESYNHCDSESLELILPLLRFLWNECPAIAWGNTERVERWLSPDVNDPEPESEGLQMKTQILKHGLVKIGFNGTQHRVFIKMSAGGWLEHNPFPGDLRGLVAAMTLATDCIAGKFYPLAVHQEEREKAAPRLIANASAHDIEP